MSHTDVAEIGKSNCGTYDEYASMAENLNAEQLRQFNQMLEDIARLICDDDTQAVSLELSDRRVGLYLSSAGQSDLRDALAEHVRRIFELGDR